MSIQRTILYGGGGLRWAYNRNLALGLGISVGLHLLLVLGYLLFGNDEEPKPNGVVAELPRLPAPPVDTMVTLRMIDMREVKIEGGGGGAKNIVDKPEGLAMQGHPDARPKLDKTKPPVDGKDIEAKNPSKVKVTDKPRDSRVATTDKDTAGRHGATGKTGQNPDGKGTKLASGSGGEGIGTGTGKGKGPGSGVGGRGWAQAPPRVQKGTVAGTVTLSYTVLPSGDIVNITPVKSVSPEATKTAISHLKRARYRPLPEDVQQVKQKGSITFTFKVE